MPRQDSAREGEDEEGPYMESCEMGGDAKKARARTDEDRGWPWTLRAEPSAPWGLILLAVTVVHLVVLCWLAWEVRQSRIAHTRALIHKEHEQWRPAPTEPSQPSPPQGVQGSTESR